MPPDVGQVCEEVEFHRRRVIIGSALLCIRHKNARTLKRVHSRWGISPVIEAAASYPHPILHFTSPSFSSTARIGWSHLDFIGIVSAMYRRLMPRAPPRPTSARPRRTIQKASKVNACRGVMIADIVLT